MTENVEVRDILADEFTQLGELMVQVYSDLEGFPKPQEQPDYYKMLENIGEFSNKKAARVLVAINYESQSKHSIETQSNLLGGIVYFGDMSVYGSGGIATQLKHTSGIRLLAVAHHARGLGIGKSLTKACISIARESNHKQVILHTTDTMQVAWKLYLKLGFKREKSLDFIQQTLPVFGFSLVL